jgi:outer membrane protein OmpA-like peptidoglycan-associated protein
MEGAVKNRIIIIITACIIAISLLSCATEPEETPVEEPVEEETVVEETPVEEPEETPVEQEEEVEEVQEIVQVEEDGSYRFQVIRLQFTPYSAQFRDEEKAILLTYASYLERFPDLTLLIKGHAARVGSEETSQSLSEERAQAVADFILGRTNIDESRMIVVGVGSSEPIGDNDTEAGRRANRRVEVSLIE